MSYKEVTGFIAFIDGRRFITGSGKQVWSGVGALKNALRLHESSYYNGFSFKELEIQQVMSEYLPYKKYRVVDTKTTRYGKQQDFEEIKNG
jgi:hypothetical protein